MMRQLTRITVVCGVLASLCCLDAAAWGPKAQRAIANTALQMVRRSVPDAFKGEAASYESDMFAGAEQGYSKLSDALPANSVEEAINAIDMEIQTLRDVRKARMGSYFAYRMGVLSSLAADVLFPFGICPPSQQSLKEKTETDIDAHLKEFSFQPKEEGELHDIINVLAYFMEKRAYVGDAAKMMAADYQDGKGYDGYLRTGSQAFFESAVVAVAECWYSVLGSNRQSGPSERTKTWYFVNEIDYLLTVKKNPHEAEKAYSIFASVNPGIIEAYEKVGDLFYDHGQRERGVQEWKTALTFPGPERQPILKKLASHYLDEGRRLRASADAPGATETALEDALKAFSFALEYNPESEDAGNCMSETRVAIAERQERYELAVGLLATAEKVTREADQSSNNGAFTDAITSYRRAIKLYQSVGEEFIPQHKAAAEGILLANNQINSIINKQIDAAREQINKGDEFLEQDNFGEARNSYQAVKSLLTDVPEDPSTVHGQNRQKLVEEADSKFAKVDEAEKRFAENEKRKKEAAEYAAKKAEADRKAAAAKKDDAAPAEEGAKK